MCKHLIIMNSKSIVKREQIRKWENHFHYFSIISIILTWIMKNGERDGTLFLPLFFINNGKKWIEFISIENYSFWILSKPYNVVVLGILIYTQ